MIIEGEFVVPVAAEALVGHLFDASLMASCLPGCEALEPLGDDRFRAVVVVAMAGIRPRFELEVAVTGRSLTELRSVTRGEEGGRASTLQADNVVTLEPLAAADDGGAQPATRVRYRSDVSVTGRLGRFALGMMRKKAQSVGDEFARNLQARLQPGSTVRA